jgi:hypothetical protein
MQPTLDSRACIHNIAIGGSNLLNVRFDPLCGLKSDISRGARSAKGCREQMHQNKCLFVELRYSITSSARASSVGGDCRSCGLSGVDQGSAASGDDHPDLPFHQIGRAERVLAKMPISRVFKPGRELVLSFQGTRLRLSSSARNVSVELAPFRKTAAPSATGRMSIRLM